MATLNITKIISAATQVNYKYFGGDQAFGFEVIGTFTFSVLDASYHSEEDGLKDGIEGLRSAYLRKNITAKIGTQIFYNAEMQSLSFPASARTGETEATVVIRDFKGPNFRPDNTLDPEISISYVNVLANNIPLPEFLENLTENFTFTRDGNGYRYNRSLNFQYAKKVSRDFLQTASVAIKNIFLYSRPSYGHFNDGISEHIRFDDWKHKPILNETYDLEQRAVSFSESLQAGLYAGFYSYLIDYSFAKTNNGFEEKTVNVRIIGIEEPIEQKVLLGIQDRLQKLIVEHSSYGQAISIEKNISINGREGTFTIVFSTDPRRSSTVDVEYSVDRSIVEGFYEYAFNITIKGQKKNYIESYYTALDYWRTNKDVGLTKVNILFGNDNENRYEKSRNTSFNKFNGTITETVVYTSNPAYLGDPENNILKIDVSTNDNAPVERKFIYKVFGNNEKIQRKFSGSKNTIGSFSRSADIIFKKVENLNQLESTAFSKISSYIPRNGWTNQAQLSKISTFNPYQGTFSVSESFNYYI